jgi:hypothetical protein
MKEPWYKDYAARGGCEDILSEFENVEEFQSTIPFGHQLNINKITLYEASIWLTYERTYGVYPTIKQINIARNLPRAYTVQDLIPEDNYAEHF